MPFEIMEMIWLGHLTPNEGRQGLCALLTVYRTVSRDWRDYLEAWWVAARQELPPGEIFSFP